MLWQIKLTHASHSSIRKESFSVSLTTDASGQLNVLGHDCDSLGVDCAQIRVFKQADHVGFTCLLDGEHCLRLEAEVTLVFSGDLSNESLEG